MLKLRSWFTQEFASQHWQLAFHLVNNQVLYSKDTIYSIKHLLDWFTITSPVMETKMIVLHCSNGISSCLLDNIYGCVWDILHFARRNQGSYLDRCRSGSNDVWRNSPHVLQSTPNAHPQFFYVYTSMRAARTRRTEADFSINFHTSTRTCM